MEQWTHMPFLCRDENGTRILLFSAANQEEIAVWKLYAQIGDQELIRLNTGFDNDVIECSTTAWHDETGWHVSFISNGVSNSDCYRLYRMDGVSLDTLSKPVAIRIARSGFIYEDRIAVGERAVPSQLALTRRYHKSACVARSCCDNSLLNRATNGSGPFYSARKRTPPAGAPGPMHRKSC